MSRSDRKLSVTFRSGGFRHIRPDPNTANLTLRFNGRLRYRSVRETTRAPRMNHAA